MTERFTETISTGIVTDNKTGIEYICEMRIDHDFLNLVNTIAEENEQLQKKNDNLVDMIARVQYRADLIKEENEQLKQFQDRVFSWIDMHLQRLPTLRDDEVESDNEFADPSLYSGAIQILETMKRELKGDVE